jgi:hypothetical protein
MRLNLDEKIVITVIATGFEDKPRAVMPSYDKWKPKKDADILKSSSRLLSKDTLKRSDESYLDVPTFMRKNGLSDKKELNTIWDYGGRKKILGIVIQGTGQV